MRRGRLGVPNCRQLQFSRFARQTKIRKKLISAKEWSTISYSLLRVCVGCSSSRVPLRYFIATD